MSRLMDRALRLVSGVILVAAMSVVAFGQTTGDSFPHDLYPLSIPTPVPIPKTLKTAPHHASDTVAIKLQAHSVGTNIGWAGARTKVHVLDGTEVDGGSIQTFPPTAGTGVPIGPQSQAVIATFWHPSAPLSGITLLNSQVVTHGILTLHVANSNPSGNSDLDVSLMFSDIYHIRAEPGSRLLTVPASDQIYVASDFPPNVPPSAFQPFPIPGGGNAYDELPPPVAQGEGHWAHIVQPMIFHVPAGQGSNYFARMATTIAMIGIEHVPEPPTALLAGGGLAFLVAGVVLRWRRQNSALSA